MVPVAADAAAEAEAADKRSAEDEGGAVADQLSSNHPKQQEEGIDEFDKQYVYNRSRRSTTSDDDQQQLLLVCSSSADYTAGRLTVVMSEELLKALGTTMR